jgi:hypothetical protein
LRAQLVDEQAARRARRVLRRTIASVLARTTADPAVS